MWLQLWFIFAKFFLSIFMSQTDLNGVLLRGAMFILSEDQIVSILSQSGFSMPPNGSAKILDIGAGDGHCTARIQTALKRLDGGSLPHMHVTETSWIMRKRLAKYENFSLVEVPDVKNLTNMDLVTCLNVLDRCADPHLMLTDIHNILSPNGGRAMLALVLPYYHYVESSKYILEYMSIIHSNTSSTPFLQTRPICLCDRCCRIGRTTTRAARSAVIAASTSATTISGGRASRRRRASSSTCCKTRASKWRPGRRPRTCARETFDNPSTGSSISSSWCRRCRGPSSSDHGRSSGK